MVNGDCANIQNEDYVVSTKGLMNEYAVDNFRHEVIEMILHRDICFQLGKIGMNINIKIEEVAYEDCEPGWKVVGKM